MEVINLERPHIFPLAFFVGNMDVLLLKELAQAKSWHLHILWSATLLLERVTALGPGKGRQQKTPAYEPGFVGRSIPGSAELLGVYPVSHCFNVCLRQQMSAVELNVHQRFTRCSNQFSILRL